MHTRIPPLLWLAAFTALMWGLDRLAPGPVVIGHRLHCAGWLLVAAGIVTAATAVLQFRRARTTVNPQALAKASSLVTSGLFACSRNPMYLGMSLSLAGWAVVLGSSSPWLVLPVFVAVITKVQIEPEEAVLSVLFGAAYADYRARVGRWFGRRT